MKKNKIKNITKQIICIIITLMLCNFIIPNITYAAFKDESGVIFAPICKFITYLCDNVMQFLQETFISLENIEQEDGTYNFQYSPGVIFSGEVPAFDINFIKPGESKTSTATTEEYVSVTEALTINGAKKIDEQVSLLGGANLESINEKMKKKYNYDSAKQINVSELEGRIKSYEEKTQTALFTETKWSSDTHTLKYAWYSQDKSNILVIVDYFGIDSKIDINGDNINSKGIVYVYEIDTYENLENSSEITDTTIDKVVATKTYNSSAGVLQRTIATWYNALRRIALVGLLSVLVYIGIQIILSSLSGKENSKYKKMLTNWIIALCLLFTLHYIMSATLLITQKISSVFNQGETDTLLNTLRNKISEAKTWEEISAEVIMYVIMTIYTVLFSIQYLKRVLYIGFFTLIAPLITLTYPLDKIKDSKAQAFTMWIREYIFNALIQVVHLVVYYTLVGSALGLVEAYPLYGIIAIGFITQGEKIIRKMFGFNNATTVGTMEAAATGGLIATALNKLQKVSNPNKEKEKTKESSTEKSNDNIRTISNSIANSLRNINPDSNLTPSQNSKKKTGIKGGVTSLAGKYGVSAVKKVGSGALKTASAATGAMLGFASGVAKGDVSEALKGAAAGGTMGSGLAQGGINFSSKVTKNIKNLGTDIKDTWNQGAYGTEYAQDAKMVREFKQTKEYKELKDEFGDRLTDDKLSELLKAAQEEQKSKK